tara:strand:- start:155 stop:376 length:222 start_codon:yes stop_codon:yes gene_type:complete
MRTRNLIGSGFRKPLTIDNIINNFEDDPIADKKDIYNQIKLDKEIKKVILYREKINNKPIDTSVLLKNDKKKK